VGGSSLSYRWWMYQPLHQQQQQQRQQQQQQQQQQDYREHDKSKLISVISSTKNETPGHAFRIQAVEFLEQQNHIAVDVYGWGRRPSRDIGDGGDWVGVRRGFGFVGGGVGGGCGGGCGGGDCGGDSHQS
jgi:hypothetical protein